METEINAESPSLNAASPRDAASARARPAEAPDQGLADYWRDWVTENPFFVHDLRRWWKRGRFLWMTLLAGGAPLLALLVLHALHDRFEPAQRTAFDRPLGLVMLCVVALLHTLVVSGFSGSNFSLVEEARADRLAFIRLLPMGGRELLAKIGVARALFRLLALLSAVPIYVVTLAYGGVPVEDLASLFALHAAFLFAPPGVAELTAALTARHGEDSVTSAQAKKPQLGPGFFIWIAIQVAFQGFGRLIIRPIMGVLLPRARAAFGTQLGGLFPASIVVGVARFLWMPQPFFRWTVVPLLLMTGYWLVRTVYKLILSAEMWGREPAQRTLPGGQNQVYLPEATWQEREMTAKRRWGGVLGVSLALLWIGFLWQSGFQSGTLGGLAGSITADGGLAAVCALVVGGAAWSMLEVIRAGIIPLPDGPWKYGLRALGHALLRMGIITLLAALLGGIVPWPETPWRLLLSGLVGLATLLFAVGWRAAFGLRDEKETGTAAKVRNAAAAVLTLVSYLGPLALVAFPVSNPLLHAAASWSPVYAILRLLPGLWRGAPPLPLPLWLLCPAALGAVLLLAGSRRAGAAAVPVERPRRDPVEDWLRRQSQRWENPYLSLALHRMLRRPNGPTQAFLSGFLTVLLLSIVIVGFILYSVTGGLQPLEILRRSTQWGLSIGALIGLGVAALTMYGALFPLDLSLMVAVQTEERAGRKQGRHSFLLISGISDRQIVTGLLGGALLLQAPTVAAVWMGSLCWALFAVWSGAPAWWLLVWLAGAVVGLGMAVQGGLMSFADWKFTPRWQKVPRQLFLAIRGMALMLLAVFGVLSWIMSQGDPMQYLLTILWVLPLLLSPVLLFLPRSLNGALANVHQARMEENLERT